MPYHGVPPVPMPATDALRYEWGHESYLPQFESCLDELTANRRAALCQTGMDRSPTSAQPPSAACTSCGASSTRGRPSSSSPHLLYVAA